MRAYLVVFALLAVIFGSIAIFLTNKWSMFAEMDFTPPPVTVAAAYSSTKNWGQYIEAIGTVKAQQGIELSSEESGQITAVLIQSGEKVQAGQSLFELNSNIQQASLQRQQASMKLAELNYKRDTKLVRQQSISQTQFDRSQADLERAQAELAETKARLANKIIRAPFDGTIGILDVDLGDYISPGTVIASLQDLSALKLDFNVPAHTAIRLATGMPIRFSVTAYANKVFTAEISAINPNVEPNTRNLKVRAKVIKGDKLVPGMFAQLQVITDKKTPVVVVPENAVSYSLHGNTLHVIETTKDGTALTARALIVDTGKVRKGMIQVLSEVQPGMQVVVAGQNKLYPGARVVIDEKVQLQ